MDKHHHQQQLPPQKTASQRCSEWVFRDVPSDIIIEVDGATFALHKFPLVSRSGRIRKLIAEHRESDVSRIELLGLPGGLESFELAAQFCYGINFEITASNVARLICVSDYLEMTDDYSPNNLASRAEEYLDSVVCKSLEMCVEVLQHCESLLPLADELQIVSRCVDAVASKACVEQIASSFSRLEYSSSGRLHMSKPAKSESDWWVEDLSALRVDLYERVIAAVKCRGVRPETVGASLVNYARKELSSTSAAGKGGGGRLVVETVVGLLPVEKFAVPLSFLFGLLRSAAALGCADGCRVELERRIGAQLEMATLDDLLIPSFNHAGDTLFDVETVHRILVNFAQMEVSEEEEEEEDMDMDMDMEGDGSGFGSDGPSQTSLCTVSKLIDSYLAEIAPDGNLKLTMFVAIAEALPAHARTLHDGLYRAIDIYLKAHQGLPEGEKRKLCKLIDFQKLSQEAGAHAAQNERLPVQSIVQVLYYEQQRLRNSLFYAEDEPAAAGMKQHPSWRINSGARSAAMSPRDNYASLRRENRDLKLELARMRMRLNDLEKDHVYMKRNLERSGSRRLMSSFSKKFVNIFGHGSSRGSMSPSRQSQMSEARFVERT
ncbi:phototropic-responsive NPH3 family protein [Striga asiatica]|uniref:Phototropic-responsive NPH3 family protein n=1 Tax=Striga asiatica TaxID=4170 RepID=A0A5A7Q7F3_STRAF|nr:phototropic-responsive NPH3 family protein [Striga asiatica]